MQFGGQPTPWSEVEIEGLRLRSVSQILIQEIGAAGPENAEESARRACGVIQRMADQIVSADARIAELEQAVTVRDTEVARLETDLELARIGERERNSLRDFANDVMESWPHGDVDGCELERMAVEHGLLALKDPKPTEPCCDNCACSGYPSPEEWSDGIDCYVRTPLLKGDAARAGNGGGV